VLGSAASVVCRPRLAKKTFIGGALFVGFYAVFMLGLKWFAPGYIGQVWNLRALSGVLIDGIPFEELLFGVAFGLYWSGVYEHYTWTESMAHARVSFVTTPTELSIVGTRLKTPFDDGRHAAGSP
jgi:hypothetical protein